MYIFLSTFSPFRALIEGIHFSLLRTCLINLYAWQRVTVFNDEVTVLEDETIEFIRDSSTSGAARPTTPTATAVLRPRPPPPPPHGRAGNGLAACCCCCPTEESHPHLDIDDDIDDTVKGLLVRSMLSAERLNRKRG